MKNLSILTLILLLFSSCHPTEEEVEILWQRHLEFKEAKLSKLLQSTELNKKSSNAIAEIIHIKEIIRTESENLLEVNHSELYLLIDKTTMKPLFESIKETEFSDSRYADLKYDRFGKNTGVFDGWNQEFFRRRTAAEALLLLTDLQLEILNYDLQVQSEKSQLILDRMKNTEELNTHK